MTNPELAETLEKIGRLLEVTGAIVFKVQAHERAAQVLRGLDRPAADVFREGGKKALLALPGIGEGIAAKLEELLTKGRSTEYEKLKKSLPPGIEILLDVPGMGPKTAMLVATKLKVRDLDGLERAIKAGKVAALPRQGEKAAAKMLKGIELLRSGTGRIPLSSALPLARQIRDRIAALPGVARVESAGSLRRMRETIGDLDFLAIPKKAADAPAILEAFARMEEVKTVTAKGDTKCSVRLNQGVDADLRVVPAESFGAALHYFTGSKAHNIRVRELGVKKGLSINEYGILKGAKRTAAATEEAIFKAVGLPFIPPEIREDTGEIEAALKGKLPRLIEADDLKGDLHMHTTWSDGANSSAEMAAAAKTMGYAYIALCDHSRSLGVARGLSIESLRKKNKEIDALNRTLKGFRVLKGAEVDILADGTLDYPDEVLAELEVVVVSVHTVFGLSEAEQTRRVTRALANRHVTLLAHPTGRLIGKRPPYAINLDEVIKAARDHGKCLELNAQTQRLDLAEGPLRRARDAGVTIAINTDSHRDVQLALGRTYGVGIGRRGWLEPGNVLNTLPLAGLLKRLAR